MIQEARHLIGDTSDRGDTQRDVHDPATGEVIGRVAWADANAAHRAMDAADAAFGGWANTPARARADILMRGAQLISDNADQLAEVLAAEAGKRLVEARGEIAFSLEYFRWFAEETRRPSGHTLTAEDNARRHLTFHRPAGVVVSLTSWNFPCSLQARKIAPALAAGCTVVCRVSERAPLAVTRMIELLREGGLPAGVINIVHGPADELSDAMLAHPSARVVTFTGSTRVGKRIMERAAAGVIRPLLELGGNAPFIVTDQADIPAAVEAAVIAKTRNTGQSCVAANRFIVQRGVFEEFSTAFASRLDALTIGHGLSSPLPDLGPMIDQRGADGIRSIEADARARGARELTTPRPTPEQPTFVRPMLFTDVPTDALLATEEVFGPVAAVFPFDTLDEAFEMANHAELGLAGYFFSASASECWRAIDELRVGIIGINDPVPSVAFAPMGGINQSGLGREGSDVGLLEFCEPKYVAWRP